MSSRPFLCIWNMYFHQQRCTNKISNQKSKRFLNSSIIVGFPKYFLSIFVIGGDTLFSALNIEIKDFYFVRRKNRSPLRAACTHLYILLHIIVCVFILQAAGCNHAATNSVVSYINKTHTYVRIHIVMISSCEFSTICKSIHHCVSPKQ